MWCANVGGYIISKVGAEFEYNNRLITGSSFSWIRQDWCCIQYIIILLKRHHGRLAKNFLSASRSIARTSMGIFWTLVMWWVMKNPILYFLQKLPDFSMSNCFYKSKNGNFWTLKNQSIFEENFWGQQISFNTSQESKKTTLGW